jgi:hypothetical protein
MRLLNFANCNNILTKHFAILWLKLHQSFIMRQILQAFKKTFYFNLFLISFMTLGFHSSVKAQISFPFQSAYQYLKGSEATELSSDWVNSDFDDSGWLTANTPFWYGDGSEGTELTDMQGNYSTLFLRTKFTATQLDKITTVSFFADWDDGFVLFINGQEVLSQQAPSLLTYDALASELHESGSPEQFDILVDELNLVEGENTLAIFACNITLSESSDFFFDMSLSGQIEAQELVDSIGIVFSHASGFCQSNFDLTMTTAIPDAYIVYTLDGSNPQTSLSAITGGASVQIAVDPESTSSRAKTPAFLVRASVGKTDYKPSKPTPRTFIFLDKVKAQTYPGDDWPDYNVNGQLLDYDVDTDVVNSAEYQDLIDDALLAIPSISLITANSNLFDSQSGIYVNALEEGAAWERECSVELIDPLGSEGFNVNAGLRIRGGYSRNDDFPKHAFRLFFRTVYGNSKLYYPLFEDEGVDHFDKVDLRCAQNYSWANSSGERNTFVREVFARDVQGEIGNAYTRSRYYHLYLNGMYWGLYQTQERSEARYASDYFGGDNEDWDVIKVGGVGDYEITATDGTLDKWREVYNLTKQGFTSNTNYFRLEGKNAAGYSVKNSEVLVDIDNLIDYMINIFYTGNFDAPVSKFGNNGFPNNIFAIKDRTDKSTGFKFLVHDAEHTMMLTEQSPGIGIQENRVNIGYLTDNYQMQVSDFSGFHMQWLHHKLVDNKEYCIRFANRAWNQLNGNGVFTETACVERLNYRANQIDKAIIGESARWGDTRTGTPFTRDNAWIPELNSLRNEYFPYRPAILMEQLREYDLYPEISAPEIMKEGAVVLDEIIYLNAPSSISFEATSGSIYYTLNGSDPRMIGGGISVHAISINSGVALSIPQSAVIKARVLSGSSWSALNEVNFVMQQSDFSKFKVTEIHYHPTDSILGNDTIDGENYEFIEFKNTDYTNAINLSGVVIDSAIYFEFPENTLLAPQQYFVVASKPKKFYDRYGLIASGNFSKNLANSGEQVLVTGLNGEVIMDFEYDDHDPWPEEPDGDGPSLVALQSNPTGDPNDYYYWSASEFIHGSPLRVDQVTGIEDPLFAESLKYAFEIYPNPTNRAITIASDKDSFETVYLKIMDVKGTVYSETSFTQQYTFDFTLLGLDYGIYFIQLKQANHSITRKVIYTP